jgi:acetylornithine/N-succinyldiaminopimelate aminotransferase
MNSDLIKNKSEKYLMHTYARLPVVIDRGMDCRVWDKEGKQYLDFVGGIAVNCLGHCHKEVVSAVAEQAQRLLHISNLYYIELQAQLAEVLVNNSFADKAFFCNSGTEANEAAIKLARIYSYKKYGSHRYGIITCHGSFHGRTMAALSATAQEKIHHGFAPLLQGFTYVPYNDITALTKAVTEKTCAVMLEPIQGEIGVILPDAHYLQKVEKLCRERNVLLILDEVQTGMGRTGKLFAYEHWGITPDIMALAKALGGGSAIGALLATDQVADAFTPGSHGTTFGGNPLACAAALATVNTLINNSHVLENCSSMGQHLETELKKIKDDFPSLIKDVRGIGLIYALELYQPCAPIVLECLDRGILINCTNNNILRFLPPLTVQKEAIDRVVEVLRDVFVHVIKKR